MLTSRAGTLDSIRNLKINWKKFCREFNNLTRDTHEVVEENFRQAYCNPDFSEI
jgi:hypothetical protein